MQTDTHSMTPQPQQQETKSMGPLPWYQQIGIGGGFKPLYWNLRRISYPGFFEIYVGPFSLWLEWPAK